ncbi:putative toxin-antitoxin system toxin component, PIN family [Candidatus Saccharibacteria bacterium]|nr:putative toxin-antitoxin system toxin component, PIN family [Candidatus Saccharibacteria bacterium]
MDNRPRVVIDTNVWVSALVFGGKPRQVVELLARGIVEVVISPEILTEMRRKIASKFPDFGTDLGLIEILLEQDAELVMLGSITVTASRDDDDNRILETALVGNCNYIVSGDKDLLVLGSYEGVEILAPAEFMEMAEKDAQ